MDDPYNNMDSHANTMESYSAITKINIMQYAGKWMELEKNHPEWDNPDQERQAWYMIMLQSTDPERLSKKEGSKSGMHISLERGNII